LVQTAMQYYCYRIQLQFSGSRHGEQMMTMLRIKINWKKPSVSHWP